jgi:hypothetical protein
MPHLLPHLARLAKGAVIQRCRRKKRPVGLARGELSVPNEFFEPLSD